ncbi:hypothetical protein [Flavobacterium crassostreae]|uniref:Uncharacterized protein n=1 Tax=Flavobacterium crassostreae TaxID=1763534 RepID=A0A1B9DYS1_9FLAO|nr:hypothetical protein [Flavobacterium crassostreae]OCB74828.1 hypothetical protein LPBF_09445 [Flavobacterium crassostreae]
MLLLGGANKLQASLQYTQTTPHLESVFFKNTQIKISNKSQDTNLIEETNTEIEEEGCFDVSKKNVLDAKQTNNKYYLPWYQNLCAVAMLAKEVSILKSTTSFCGYSSPIFARQRVLRI